MMGQHVAEVTNGTDFEVGKVMDGRMWKDLRTRLLSLHRDERGADMLEYILIVAAVALPLLAVVIWFWKDIRDWAVEKWEDIKSDTDEPMD